LLAITFAFGYAEVGFATWLYDAESLDQLFEAYAVGEIDFATLTLLSGSYDLGGLDQADLLAAGVIERIDPLAPGDRPISGSFLASILGPGGGKIGVRRSSNEEGEISASYYLTATGEHWKAKGQAEENRGRYAWDHRSFSGFTGPIEFTLGNYIISEGHGLMIGRFDFLPSAGLSATREEGFLYPLNSYYNGLKLTLVSRAISGGLYYSRKRFESTLKQFAGSGISVRVGGLSGGLAMGINRLEQNGRQDQRIATGISLDLRRPRYKLYGELAFLGRAPATFLGADRFFGSKIIKIEFWRYDEEYNSYNCSGPAATDYRSFYPEGGELGFRSAQAGETGLFTSYGNSAASISAQFWTRAQDETINSTLGFQLRNRLRGKIEGYVQGTLRDKTETDYGWIKIGIIPGKNAAEQFGVKLYARDSPRISNPNSFVFIDVARNIKTNLSAYCRIKWYFNGRNRWFFGERIDFGWGVSGQVEAVIDRRTIANLKIEKAL